MRKILDVVGLPVLNTGTGQNVGTVKDILFNDGGELTGLTVETGGLFAKDHFLSFFDIESIGDDAVTITDEQFLIANKKNQYHGFQTGKKAFKEMPVVTTNGHELGHIKDVYFMEEVGKIVGYELSDGFFSDITEGRRTIELPKHPVFGDDALVIPRDEVKNLIFGIEVKEEGNA